MHRTEWEDSAAPTPSGVGDGNYDDRVLPGDCQLPLLWRQLFKFDGYSERRVDPCIQANTFMMFASVSIAARMVYICLQHCSELFIVVVVSCYSCPLSL